MWRQKWRRFVPSSPTCECTVQIQSSDFWIYCTNYRSQVLAANSNGRQLGSILGSKCITDSMIYYRPLRNRVYPLWNNKAQMELLTILSAPKSMNCGRCRSNNRAKKCLHIARCLKRVNNNCLVLPSSRKSVTPRTHCITRRFLYTEWGTVLFTLKWLSANLEQWPSFNQAEQFKQPDSRSEII